MKTVRRIYQHFFREPMQHVSAGDLPEGFKDAITSRIKLNFGWRARFAILLGCEVEVTDVTYCEHAVGRLQTKTGLWIYDPTAPPSKALGMVEVSAALGEHAERTGETFNALSPFLDRGLPIILSPEAKADARARWGSDESESHLDYPEGADDVRFKENVK